MGPYTTLLASQSGEPDEQVLARLEERYRHDRSESGVPPPHMNTRYATVDEGENDSRKKRGHHPCRLGDTFAKADDHLQEGRQTNREQEQRHNKRRYRHFRNG